MNGTVFIVITLDMNDLPVMKWRAGWRGERRSGGLEVKEPLIVVSAQLFTGTAVLAE